MNQYSFQCRYFEPMGTREGEEPIHCSKLATDLEGCPDEDLSKQIGKAVREEMFLLIQASAPFIAALTGLDIMVESRRREFRELGTPKKNCELYTRRELFKGMEKSCEGVWVYRFPYFVHLYYEMRCLDLVEPGENP